MKAIWIYSLSLWALFEPLCVANKDDNDSSEVVQWAGQDGHEHVVVKKTTGSLRQSRQRRVQEATRDLQSTARLPLVEVVLQNFSLKFMEAYLNFGLSVPDISGSRPLTFLPPWDDAWEALPTDLVQKLRTPTRAWVAHLQNLIRYHIIDQLLLVDDLEETQTVDTKNGESAVINRRPGTSRLTINDGIKDVLVLAIYDATNGVAYMLDDVLQPAWVTNDLRDIASSNSKFSTLTSLIVSAGLESELLGSGTALTIFAPNNDAFDQQNTRNRRLQSDEDLLRNTLLYHMAPGGPFPSLTFTSRSQATLLEGSNLQIRPATNAIEGAVNQAGFVTLDIPASNGLIHEIDTVLLLEPFGPPSTTLPTDTPTSTPTKSPTVSPSTTPPTDTPTSTPTKSPTVTPTPPATPVPSPASVFAGWVEIASYSVPRDWDKGASVALLGPYAIVGGPGFRYGQTRTGRLDFFIKSGESWDVLGFEAPENAALREFGSAIDLSYSSSDDRYGLVAGAPLSTRPGTLTGSVGAARYYQLSSASRWVPFGPIIYPPDGDDSRNSNFGSAVAVAVGPQRLAIGAPNYADNGQVFVYDMTSNNAVQGTITGPSSGSLFGAAADMSLTGDLIVVGAPGAQGASPGAIYIYTENSGTWTESFSMSGPDSTSNFGTKIVLVEGETTYIAVAAPTYGGNRGLVRILEQTQQGSWRRLGGDIVGQPGEFLGTSLDGSDTLLATGTVTGTFRTYEILSDGWVRQENDIFSELPVSPVSSISVDGDEILVVREDEIIYFFGRGSPLLEWSTFRYRLSGMPNIQYGNSVSIAGLYTAVGAPGDDSNRGSVYFVEKTSDNLVGNGRAFESSLTTRAFGSAIYMSHSENDDRYGILVGAPESIDASGATVLGAAFYYERSATGTWELMESLNPDFTPLANGGGYGAAVALATGTKTMVVGAPTYGGVGNNAGNGRVFVYQPNQSGSLVEIGTILTGASAGSLFGSAVDVSKGGNIIVVGAPGAPGAASGAVYIYSDAPTPWSLSLAMPGPDSLSNFGTAVAILDDDATLIAVGAPGYDSGRGLVRVFERSSLGWDQISDDIVGSTAGDALGTSVAGNDGILIVGTTRGTVQAYRYLSNAWELAAEELELENRGNDNSIAAVAMDGSSVVISRLLNSEQVWIYELN